MISAATGESGSGSDKAGSGSDSAAFSGAAAGSEASGRVTPSSPQIGVSFNGLNSSGKGGGAGGGLKCSFPYGEVNAGGLGGDGCTVGHVNGLVCVASSNVRSITFVGVIRALTA